jgi:hypothetical protein
MTRAFSGVVGKALISHSDEIDFSSMHAWVIFDRGNIARLQSKEAET